MKKTFSVLVLLAMALAVNAGSGPTWVLTVPTADIIPKDQLNIGLFNLDIGVSNNIEAGLRGIKYGISYPDNSKLAFGASLFSGLYPYAVYTKDYDFGKLSIGLNIFPYFIFAGYEKSIDPNTSLLAEIHNGISIGVRNRIARDWVIDLGGGFSTYAYKSYFFLDYANSNNYSFTFPNNMSPFLVVSICYSFSITPSVIPELKPEDKPIDKGNQPIDPIK